MVKKRYEVRWYEHDLTKERVKSFRRKLWAVMFAAYMEAYEYVKVKIKEIEDDDYTD